MALTYRLVQRAPNQFSIQVQSVITEEWSEISDHADELKARTHFSALIEALRGAAAKKRMERVLEQVTVDD